MQLYYNTFLKFLLVSLCIILHIEMFAANKVSTGSTAWGTASTWFPTGVPAAGDNVTILAGHTITMNGNAGNCLSLTIRGTANWTQARTTNVGAGGLFMSGGTITGSATGILNVLGPFTMAGTNNIARNTITVTGVTTVSSMLSITSATGTKTFTNFIITSPGVFNNTANSAITINGNFQNDGTFTSGIGMYTFGGAANNTLIGISVSNFTGITINKGTSSNNILDIQSIITLPTVAGAGNGLTLTNGTFKLSSASTIIPFPNGDLVPAGPFLIPATAGFWCNGGIVNTMSGLSSNSVDGSGNWTVAGVLRISAGTLNLGTAADQRLRADNSGTTQLIIEGGVFNVSGRLSRQLASDNISFTMTAGIINVPTVASTDNTFPPINMDQPGSSFTMTGGTIILLRAGGIDLGFLANAGTVGISGGTIQVGDASTPAGQTIGINSVFNISKLAVSSANATCLLQSNLSALQSVTINSGRLNLNNFNLSVGGIWTNNGTFTPGTGVVTFNGTGTQNIIKTGGENFYSFTVNKSSGTVLLNNDVAVTNTLTLTSGDIDCGANLLTLGTSTVSVGSLTYTSGKIIGCFKRWVNATGVNYLMPIGTSSFYRPAQINFTTLTSGALTACFVSTNPGSSGLPVVDNGLSIANQYTEGFWDLTAGNGLVSTSYNIDLTGNGFVSYPVSVSTRILYRSLASNPWILSGTHIAAVGNTAKRTIAHGLSAQFCFGKPTCSGYSAVAISGNNSVCINSAATYSVTNTVGNTYTWTATGGTIASAQGTNTVTVNWGAISMTGSVTVTEKNTCGDDNTPVAQPININPIATSTITGSTVVSTNQTGVSYTVTPTLGYTYSWTLPAGGGSVVGGQGTSSVTINWGATAGTYSVRVTTTRLCGAPDVQNLSVLVRATFYSRINGNWGTAATWSKVACGSTVTASTVPGATDEVIICSGHTIVMNGNAGACRKLTINGTANWTQARTTNVGSEGVYISSTGNITGTANGVLTSTGGFFGTGNGNISSSTVIIRLQTNPQNISCAGALNNLDIITTATNTGTVTIANSGTLSGSGTLTQSANSIFSMKGTTFSLSGLVASASGNTVEYGTTASQQVRNGTYHHLKLSGSGTKTLSGSTVLNGNLDIVSVSLDVSTNNYALDVAGNWTNSGTFNPRFSTATFNGSSAQSITNSGGEVFNNLIMTGIGAKSISNNITINFDFSLGSVLSIGANNISIRGNFDNSGTFNSSAGSIVNFINNSRLLGTSPITFQEVIISGILTGHATNFNVTGNWTNNGTFVHNSGTVTFNGISSIAGSSTTGFGGLTVAGTLTAPSNLQVARNLLINGTFTHNNGTVTMNGNVAQTIGGTSVPSFYNLTQNNSAGVSITQDVKLINTLTISSGTFTTTGKIFTLVSNVSNTANIAAIPSGANLTGSIVMERYTGTGPTDWRQLSSSISGTTIADWADDFPTSGFTGSTDPTNGFVSIYTYDETLPGNKDNAGWVGATNITNPIVAGKGYYVYMGPNPISISVKGPPQKFVQSIPVTFSNSGSINDDGWNLVSNNYPSAIDWRNLTNWTKTNVDSAIYIYNTSTGSYSSYASGIGVNGGSRYIASSQAFWVKANANSPVLSLVETVKVASNPSFLRKQSAPNTSHYPMAFKDFPVDLNVNDVPNSIRLMVSNNGLDDEIVIRFDQSATTSFDSRFDAWKLDNDPTVHNFSSVFNDTSDLSISSLPDLTSDVSIKLRLRVPASGTYTIRRDSVLMLAMSSCIQLEDLLTGTITDLRQNISYTFSISDTTQAPRFILHISAPITKQSAASVCNGDSNGLAVVTGVGTGPWNYTWKDSLGNILQNTLNATTSDTLFNIPAGIYTVETSGSACGIVSDTITVGYLSNMNLLPVSTDISCMGLNNGAVMVVPNGGVPAYSFLWSTGDTSNEVQNLSPGNYSVTVSDAAGCSKKIVVSISSTPVLFADFLPVNSDTVILSVDSTKAFLDLSSGGFIYSWNFGDGSALDSTANPSHTYSLAGTYTVSFTIADSLCSHTAYQTITVLDSLSTSISNYTSNNGLGVYYQNGEVFLSINLQQKEDVLIDLYNVVGEKLSSTQHNAVQQKHIKLTDKNLTPGLYFVDVKSANFHQSFKIFISSKQ